MPGRQARVASNTPEDALAVVSRLLTAVGGTPADMLTTIDASNGQGQLVASFREARFRDGLVNRLSPVVGRKADGSRSIAKHDELVDGTFVPMLVLKAAGRSKNPQSGLQALAETLRLAERKSAPSPRRTH